MEIKKVLENLEKLFKKWGLGHKDWILTAGYAMKLQGYAVKLRRGHLNTFINKDKLPWKVREGYEVFPPNGSIWANEYSIWMKTTGFDTDLIVYSSKRLKKLSKDTILYQLPNGKKIHLVSMVGNMKSLGEYLIHCREEEVGVEKGRYLLEVIEDMRRAAQEKRDKKSVSLASKLLEKYQYLRVKSGMSEKGTDWVKGIIAYEGKVKGKVRKILGKGDRIGTVGGQWRGFGY